MAVRFLHGGMIEESINGQVGKHWCAAIGETMRWATKSSGRNNFLLWVQKQMTRKERQSKQPRKDSPKDEVASSVHG